MSFFLLCKSDFVNLNISGERYIYDVNEFRVFSCVNTKQMIDEEEKSIFKIEPV